MLKALVTAGGYTSGNIPLTLNQNTNGKYELNEDSSIDIKVGGLTEIKGNIVITGTAAAARTVQLYVNGVAVEGALDTQTLADGSNYTFHINDIVKTIVQPIPAYATIALRVSGACTLVGGDVILTFER